MAADDGIDVRVVPTVSPVQGLAALSVADPDAGPSDRVDGMVRTADHVRVGSLTRATGDGEIDGRAVRAGEFVAWVGSEAVGVGADLPEAVGLLVLILATGQGRAEAVTLVGGRSLRGVTALAERLEKTLDVAGRPLEITVVDGGQRHPLLLVGVE